MNNKLFTLVACTLMVTSLWADNVDLTTIPNRDTVELTIYNSEDLTLVKERRMITVKKGANRLQFSWAGTLIDPTSVEFRPLSHVDEVDVADTVYPGQKPQHLFWNVESEYEGQLFVEVSYFTSGLTWQMDYVATSSPDESKMKFRGYVRVFNRSGEEYENAQVRLIVGNINLVEKIATLARQKGIPVPDPNSAEHKKVRRLVAKDAFADAEGASMSQMSAAGQKKQIVKQGVSEYFMFSIEGTETIPNGWSKRLQAVKANDIKFDIVYRMRSYQYGNRPVRFYIWRNDADHELGETPLPNGIVRVFRDNGRDGLSFLGQQKLNYVPVQADIEVNLGVDDLVVYERRKTNTRRSDFSFDRYKRVNGWNESQSWLDTVRNYRDKPIKFELRLQWTGDVTFVPRRETTSFDYRTVESTFIVQTLSKQDVAYDLEIRQGGNAKQARVQLKPRRAAE